ncbi:MAG TPA: CoA-binding protein [Deltaproteobacteria bacterium]|nr:CoA-binding protein [Candidatus Binatota bacterium]HIL14138.1 CoA-binding protein [Deltaproteobacteria bacterium]
MEAVPEIPRRLLTDCRIIAVVGLSDDPGRASHRVAAYLLAAGYEIEPVNPRVASVLGRDCSPDLASLPQPVDIVQVFRRSQYAGEVVDAAIEAGIPAVWLQDGVVDEQAAARAQQAGMDVVMDRCMMRDHALLDL